MAKARSRCRAVIAATTLGLAAAMEPTWAQQPTTPPADASGKRMIDAYSGILFVCRPLNDRPWTIKACDAIAREAGIQAKAANVRLVRVASFVPDQFGSQATTVGFDADNAIQMLARFRPLTRREGGTNLTFIAQVRVAPTPAAAKASLRSVFLQGSIFDEGTTLDQIADAARIVLRGFFGVFGNPPPGPRKPRQRPLPHEMRDLPFLKRH